MRRLYLYPVYRRPLGSEIKADLPNLANECEVQLSYCISLSRPASVQVETFGSGRLSDDDLAALVERTFDFRPAGILRNFNFWQLTTLNKGSFIDVSPLTATWAGWT